MKLSRTVGVAVAVSLVAGTAAALAQISGAAPADPTANVVDAAGHLRVPADYRTLYQALGSWAIAADSGQGSKEMRTVYASPSAYGLPCEESSSVMSYERTRVVLLVFGGLLGTLARSWDRRPMSLNSMRSLADW
jgi:hypothetical protein